jgi:hypothetical protein
MDLPSRLLFMKFVCEFESWDATDSNEKHTHDKGNTRFWKKDTHRTWMNHVRKFPTLDVLSL